jgi:hypothetical protein
VRRPWPRALAALAVAGPGLGVLGALGALGAVAAQAQESPAGPGDQAAPAAPAAPGEPIVPAAPGEAAAPASAVHSVLGPVVAPVIATHGGPTWQPLPEVAAQARAAVAGLTEDPMDAVAHGDPSMGCFVLVLRLGSGGVTLHRALHDAFAPDTEPDTRPDTAPDTAADEPPLTVSDWTMAGDGPGVRSGFAFARESLQGQVQVMSRGQQQQQDTSDTAGAPAGDTMLVACFHDAREPARSARLCERMLPAIEDALQTIPETFP